MIRTVLLATLVWLPIYAQPSTLAQKYPSYRYVFDEFDVDNGYIYDPSFAAFVHKYGVSLERFYHRSVQRGGWVLPMLRGELLERGLSDLLVYLSMVESGLSLDAVSSKKAVGLWQFMPTTARAYHLDVCYSVDERCDPFLATRAAMSHLEALHAKFGKWYLAVMAYNCGEGRMRKAIKAAGTDDIEVLLNEQTDYLPKETREYMRKILLVAMIGESETIAFSSQEALPPFAVSKEVHPSQEPDRHVSRDHLLAHYVRTGETLEQIASDYNSSVEAIRRVNRLRDDYLESERLLLIPVSRERFEHTLSGQS